MRAELGTAQPQLLFSCYSFSLYNLSNISLKIINYVLKKGTNKNHKPVQLNFLQVWLWLTSGNLLGQTGIPTVIYKCKIDILHLRNPKFVKMWTKVDTPRIQNAKETMAKNNI